MFHRAVGLMVLGAALYEPMRLGLHRLGEEVGGVGGVGGLVNLWNPEDCPADRLSALAEAYCYHPGIFLGFTAFSLVVTLLWALPMLCASFAVVLQTPPATEGAGLLQASPEPEKELRHFRQLWLAMSCLWFCVPFASYAADPFYRTDAVHLLLALAIAAAFPLSWHLAFVALPVGRSLGQVLGPGRELLLQQHKFIAWELAAWATLHGLGEAIYLFVTDVEGLKVDGGVNGEHLLYILGLLLLVTLGIHVTLAALRKLPKVRQSFRAAHRLLAGLVLLLAAAHWWPFALFLVPSAAVHGFEAATALRAELLGPRSMGIALAAAMVANLAALALVWSFRESYMSRAGANLLVPFLFPPLALVLGFLASFVAALLSLLVKLHR